MVSNQCEGKVQSLLNSMPAEQVTEIKPDLISIKDEFNLEEHEDDEAGLNEKFCSNLVTRLFFLYARCAIIKHEYQHLMP